MNRRSARKPEKETLVPLGFGAARQPRDPWRILVVDGDADAARAVADVLASPRHRCEVATNGGTALTLCRELEFDAVVTNMRLAGMDGIELMGRVRSVQRDVPVILMTSEGSVSAAVDAVKLGAFQYVTKPCEPSALRAVIGEAIASRAESARPAGKRGMPIGTEELVGSGATMAALRAQIELVAKAIAPVLIVGETGTGKELVARAIHSCSPRRARPFVTVNASAIPEALLESELFGHARGAFTGAANAHRGVFQDADGGTLLLDEIGDMPFGLQSKLLRVLQEGEVKPVGAERALNVDVRVLAATHRRLPDLVRDGRFREDLFYRLNVVALTVPPLRNRVEDLEELTSWLLARARARAPASPARSIHPDLAVLFATESWPGNVRELESTIERLVVLAREPELRPEHLAASAERTDISSVATDDPSLDRLIQRHVESILQRTDGNKIKAAKLLGVDLSTLYRWQRKWGRG